jgi:hypothetical protein
MGMARRCCCLGGDARADGGGNDREDRTRYDLVLRAVARLETELRVSRTTSAITDALRSIHPEWKPVHEQSAARVWEEITTGRLAEDTRRMKPLADVVLMNKTLRRARILEFNRPWDKDGPTDAAGESRREEGILCPFTGRSAAEAADEMERHAPPDDCRGTWADGRETGDGYPETDAAG